MLITILTLWGSLLPTLLKSFGVSTTIDNLAAAAASAIAGIVQAIQSKGSVSVDLTALQTALTALEADTSLSPVILGDINEGISALKAGIAAYQAAQKTTDPSTLTPLPTV